MAVEAGRFAQLADETEVQLGGISFTIEELPAKQARRVWREMLHAIGDSPLLDAIGQINLTDANEYADILAVIRGILQLDVDFVEHLQAQMFQHVMFTSAEAVTSQPITGAEPMSLDHLDVVESDELMIRALAVNFTEPVRKFASRVKPPEKSETPEDSPSPSS